MSAEFLDETACSSLRARSLFYPSAGQDTRVPVATFWPWIRDFWFVDINCDLTRPFRKSDRESDQHEILSGTTLRTGEPFEVSVRHERYRWSRPHGDITIHRCRGRGYDVFRTVFSSAHPISVFFHRGDSPGNGGSNFYWLGKKRLPDVLHRLEPDGLVVSDGSNAMRPFRWGSESDVEVTPDRRPAPFRAAGRRFICVGCLDRRYGPTIVWKATRDIA
jgi:hypothetical protein